jgi:hypothetical protein
LIFGQLLLICGDFQHFSTFKETTENSCLFKIPIFSSNKHHSFLETNNIKKGKEKMSSACKRPSSWSESDEESMPKRGARSTKRSKFDESKSPNATQIAKDCIREVVDMIEKKLIMTKDKNMDKFQWESVKQKYVCLSISTKRSILSHVQRTLDMLIAKEAPRRNRAKLWARKVRDEPDLTVDIFPRTYLDWDGLTEISDSNRPACPDIGDWIKNVMDFETIEEFNRTESTLNSMLEFVTTTRFKFNSEFKALHFLMDFFTAEIQSYGKMQHGLFDVEELSHTKIPQSGNEI